MTTTTETTATMTTTTEIIVTIGQGYRCHGLYGQDTECGRVVVEGLDVVDEAVGVVATGARVDLEAQRLRKRSNLQTDICRARTRRSTSRRDGGEIRGRVVADPRRHTVSTLRRDGWSVYANKCEMP